MQGKNKQPQVVTPILPKPINIKTFAENQWSEVLSDHSAQLMAITKDICLLSWNIMTLGRGHNNAYRKKEDPEIEYKSRLRRIAEELRRQIRSNHKLAVIALQEAPHFKEYRIYFFDALRNNLPSHWVIANTFYQKSKGNNFGTLTLYDNSKLEKPPVVKTIPELTYQQGRVLVMEFFFAVGERKAITIVNGHFRYDNERKERMTIESSKHEINCILKSAPGQIILAADLNQPTQLIAQYFAGRCYYSRGMTSLSYESKQKKLVEQNIDAFIFKRKVIL